MDITIVISWTFEKEMIAMSSVGRGQFGDMCEDAAAPLSNTLGVDLVV
ncbi:MAG TPA: hypothetical protein VEH86_04550 [Candidatus Acidoferrum sp.]|nr:hypothetical protein [Candidatus Acidoferrum sp.]